jgi:hypothetical protein
MCHSFDEPRHPGEKPCSESQISFDPQESALSEVGKTRLSTSDRDNYPRLEFVQICGLLFKNSPSTA